MRGAALLGSDGARHPDKVCAGLEGQWHAHVLDARLETHDLPDGCAGI